MFLSPKHTANRPSLSTRLSPSPLAWALALAFAGAALSASTVQAQSKAAQLPKSNQATTQLSADSVTGNPETSVRLEGNVNVERGSQKIVAPVIDYSAASDEVKATGGVVLIQGRDVFRAPTLQINLATEAGFANQVDFFYSKHNARGSAQTLQMSPNRVHTLGQTRYTTCSPGQDDWEIAAKSIELDNNTETGYAKNLVFKFFNVPLLALPYFEFPLGKERRSGVLPPTVSISSGTGLDISAPYYFNLASNYDLTLNTRLMGRRGLQMSATQRYLTNIGAGDLTLDAMPHDRVLGQKRWGAFAQHTHKVDDLSMGWTVQRVSDDLYFKDLSKSIGSAAQSHLPMDVWTRYKPQWGLIEARAVQYQTLQDAGASIVPTYGRLPSVSVALNPWGAGNSQWRAEANVTRFTHATQVEGVRAYALPQWQWENKRDWGYFKAKAGINATHYSGLGANNGSYSGVASANRVLPVVSLDSGVTFERSTQWLGTLATQTLEPRLFYLNVPFKEQSHLPNFDTAASDFGFTQIFSDNVFNGNDRVADANHLTAALTSRWIGSANSAELFKLTFGKRYYITPQRVQLIGPSVAGSATSSDWLLAAAGSVGAGVYFDVSAQYDQTTGDTIKSAVTLKYNPQARRFVSVSKRFTKNAQDLVDLAWQWKVSPSSAIMGRVNYSLGVPAGASTPAVAKGTTESLLGYEYDAGCWVFRVAANRYSTAANTKNTSVYFQVDFSGLTRLGSGSLDTLKRNVPGYTPFESKPTWSYDPFKTY